MTHTGSSTNQQQSGKVVKHPGTHPSEPLSIPSAVARERPPPSSDPLSSRNASGQASSQDSADGKGRSVREKGEKTPAIGTSINLEGEETRPDERASDRKGNLAKTDEPSSSARPSASTRTEVLKEPSKEPSTATLHVSRAGKGNRQSVEGGVFHMDRSRPPSSYASSGGIESIDQFANLSVRPQEITERRKGEEFTLLDPQQSQKTLKGYEHRLVDKHSKKPQGL